MLISALLLMALVVPSLAHAVVTCTDGGAVVQEDGTPADPDAYPTYTAPSGTNTITIAGVGYRDAVARAGTPTIGGNAMTAITANNDGTDVGGRLWYRLNVTPGSADLSVNWDVAPLASSHGVVTCSGVDQVSPIRATNTAIGTGSPATVTVAGCLAGDMIVDFVTKDGTGTYTVGADQTEIAQAAGPAEMNGAISRQDGSGDGVMSWTFVNVDWTIQAVCLAAANDEVTGGAIWYP